VVRPPHGRSGGAERRSRGVFKKPMNGKNGMGSEGALVRAECLVIRDEIMVAASAGWPAVVTEGVTIHLERCASCREWEADYRIMHGLCRESQACADPSRLTSSVIRACTLPPDRAGEARADAAADRLRVRDRGVLAIVSLAVLAFNVILALSLVGRTRVIYPVVLFACMLVLTMSVYRDSRRRGMNAAFWAALMPFTVPAGFAVFLVRRARGSSKCPACGRTVRVVDRFCPECGRALAEFCCGCGRPVRKEFRVCPFCGTRLEECAPFEDRGAAPCDWSRAQIAFIAIVNTVLLGVLLAALLRGGFIVMLLVLLGYFPLFNWVEVDSRRRAMRTVPWGVFVLLTFYVGLVIYLACRKDERVLCPVCGSYPPTRFNFCPCCGSALGAVCASCGVPAVPGNRFCTSCGAEWISAGASPPSRG